MNSVPPVDASATMDTDAGIFHFDLSMNLVRTADLSANPAIDWKARADHWHITVMQRELGNVVAFSHWMGRQSSGSLHHKAPNASAFLASIGDAVFTAYEMPADDVKALVWMEEEGLCQGRTLEQSVEVLFDYRETFAKVVQMLTGTSIDASHWAAWASQLKQ